MVVFEYRKPDGGFIRSDRFHVLRVPVVGEEVWDAPDRITYVVSNVSWDRDYKDAEWLAPVVTVTAKPDWDQGR